MAPNLFLPVICRPSKVPYVSSQTVWSPLRPKKCDPSYNEWRHPSWYFHLSNNVSNVNSKQKYSIYFGRKEKFPFGKCWAATLQPFFLLRLLLFNPYKISIFGKHFGTRKFRSKYNFGRSKKWIEVRHYFSLPLYGIESIAFKSVVLSW